MTANQDCIDVCNSLLRGELSAVETYSQALEKFKGDPAEGGLRSILADHEHSVATLRQHLVSMGAEPAASSGAWGTFAQAVEGAAKMFGESSALAALEQGEEHGVSEYHEALEDEGVMEEIKDEIRQTLLPRLTGHIATLKRFRA